MLRSAFRAARGATENGFRRWLGVRSARGIVVGGVAAYALGLRIPQRHQAAVEWIPLAHCAAAPTSSVPNFGKRVEGLPDFTVEEIAQHNHYSRAKGKGQASSVWVHYKAGVYDITDFVAKHPGGEKRIMLAAGGSIEKFWAMYTQHQDDAVRTILEGYRVGNVKNYVATAAPSTDELWKHEPRRAAGLHVLNQRPFNAETPEAIIDQFITPNELFFVRNHMPVPNIELGGGKKGGQPFCLQVDGEGIVPHCFTMEELIAEFPQHTVTTTIQCGGNRRKEMEAACESEDAGSSRPRAVKGLSWTGGGIGTAQWTGVYLRDVVRSCQMPDGAKADDGAYNDSYHIHLFGADNDAAGQFSVSVPYEVAMDPKQDVVIAWEMNGEPIPRDHGYPLRAIVPGTVGVRNCKWLNRVSIQPEESQSVWQQSDYKNFPSWLHKPDPSLPSVMSMPVQSKVTSAVYNTSNDEVEVKGYAYCGGGTGIQRVELSVDGGKTFTSEATLLDNDAQRFPKPTRSRRQHQQWAWTQFQSTVDVSKLQPHFPVLDADGAPLPAPPEGGEEPKTFRVCSKAVTADNQSQPATGAYNFRGLLYNAYSCRDATVD